MLMRMTKLRGGEAIRTSSVVGAPKKEPTIGESYFLLCPPLSPLADARIVNTSAVVAINGDVIVTETGSQYRIQKESEAVKESQEQIEFSSN